MKFSTFSTPILSIHRRTRVPWFAISSTIFRLVNLKLKLFLKKSLWP